MKVSNRSRRKLWLIAAAVLITMGDWKQAREAGRNALKREPPDCWKTGQRLWGEPC